MTADSYGGWGNRETRALSEVLQEDASLRGLVALRFATIRNSGKSGAGWAPPTASTGRNSARRC